MKALTTFASQQQEPKPTHPTISAPEDTSIEDACRDMEAYWHSPQFRLIQLRSRIHYLWLRLICALTEHKPKEWGAKYWTDYGYEYDGGVECTRCGIELR